jgi:branched-chain amino acid transport system permease protein
VYGIIQLINFAHGEIYMIGAMTALIIASVLGMWGWHTGVIVILAFVFAIVYSCAYGFTVEKIAYKPLRNAPRLSALISAIGMSLFLQNYVMLAQTPDFLPFMILLGLLIKFTRIGKAMRATAQDKVMAALLGINVNNVISATFVVGSATAAIGGVLIACHVGQINFYIGFLAGLKAFIAAVLGGIGSIPGAVLGSLVLGISESFFTGYFWSEYEDVFAFSILVLILIFRPSGILGRHDTQKV